MSEGKTSSHNLDKTSGSGEEEGWREEENLENGILGGSAPCPPFSEFQGKKKKKNLIGKFRALSGERKSGITFVN